MPEKSLNESGVDTTEPAHEPSASHMRCKSMMQRSLNGYFFLPTSTLHALIITGINDDDTCYPDSFRTRHTPDVHLLAAAVVEVDLYP